MKPKESETVLASKKTKAEKWTATPDGLGGSYLIVGHGKELIYFEGIAVQALKHVADAHNDSLAAKEEQED